MTLAALRNAARLTGRGLGGLRAVGAGAGACGDAVAKILLRAGIGDIALADSRGNDLPAQHALRSRPG